METQGRIDATLTANDLRKDKVRSEADQKTKQMETQTYLKEYFYKSVIKQSETYRQFVVRLETVYRHLSANNITLPDDVQGWLLLKKLALDNTHEALF